MNVSLQNIDKVSALLTIKLEKADYQEQVEKSLKNIRQKAQVPGFRQGMVPMSLVKKMYAKSVMAEEVNKLLSERVYGYIKENNLNILGEPLPNVDRITSYNVCYTKLLRLLCLRLLPLFLLHVRAIKIIMKHKVHPSK